ncbi:sigma-70 family RNA polymerase sigma factor [Methylovulum miyakonense]|uniref:sigma-70 family RNA polymerase sigma factor n=1 Tax=Methylovulum miyakonense TaxID=645578 RepID=UPI00039F9F10|nr:RNA polymerase sigma factor RpoD/SigA [Methylovulum miyakonense]
MAYLTEHLSRQELGAVVKSGGAGTVSSQFVSSVSPAQVTNEHCNFEIARRLNDEKYKLINGLSQFPATALLLLNAHEKMAGLSEQDEESALVSDLASALSEIKKYFLEASQSLSGAGQSDSLYLGYKQNLVSVLQAFPFSFEELNKITEVIVYAYKIRGLCYQPAHEADSKNSGLIIRRLEGSKRRNRANVSSMADLFREIDGFDYDEQFLFLPTSEMHKYFTDIVIAEHRWLAARKQLAEANNKLVLFIANQYKAGFLDFEDLVQEGQTGLLKAVDRFDYRLGFQFSTYAGYWIRQAISRSLSRCERLVRVPCGQVANMNKLFRAKNELMAKTGQEPSVAELSEYTKLSSDDVNMILSISQTVMCLEGTEDEEDAFAPIDYLEQQVFIHAFTSIAEDDLDRLLGKAIGSLNSREAKVICSHFGVDADKEMTLQEIGGELNLTRERVRQIQVMALNKIKANYGQQLMCFL